MSGHCERCGNTVCLCDDGGDWSVPPKTTSMLEAEIRELRAEIRARDKADKIARTWNTREEARLDLSKALSELEKARALLAAYGATVAKEAG